MNTGHLKEGDIEGDKMQVVEVATSCNAALSYQKGRVEVLHHTMLTEFEFHYLFQYLTLTPALIDFLGHFASGETGYKCNIGISSLFTFIWQTY